MSTLAVRAEYHYVHPAVELGGEELDYLEVDGIDMAGVTGYADIFATPQTSEAWTLLPSKLDYLYVHPAIEMAGVEVDYFEINGIELANSMYGYADSFAMLQTSPVWVVPRIEPHHTPAWKEPLDRFQ